MPELVGLAAQGKLVIWRHHLSVRADGTEDHKMRSRTLRTDLRHLRWAEAARKGELKLVGHILLTEHQNGMFLEGRARCRIGGIVRGDIGKRQAAQFGGESRTQRDNVHRQVLPVSYAVTLRQNRPAGNDQRPARSGAKRPAACPSLSLHYRKVISLSMA